MLIAAGVAVVLGVVYLSMSGSGVVVETARVERDTLQVTVSEEGRTRLRERYAVAAPVAGQLARIEIEEGDSVEQGEIVARMYPRPEDPRDVGIARAQLEAAQARRREAEARAEEARERVDQLERQLKRSRALVRDSIISEQEFEQNQLAAASARRQLEATRAALRAARADVAAARARLTGIEPGEANVESVPVRAPSAGRVLRVLEKSERVVQAGTPLVEIGDARGLEIVVDVLSADAVPIQPGDIVLVDEWGGGRTLQGRVHRVEPDAFTEVSALGVEEQRVNVIVDPIRPPASLGSGYRVEASIVTWTGAGVLTVPTSALFRRDGAWHVFAVEEGEAVLRAVTLGHRSAEAAEIVGGLDASDEVILFPSDQIEEGVSVAPRRG